MSEQSSQRDHDAYFEYALGGILDTDGNWTILRANAAAASILGLDRRAFPGRRLQDILAAGEAPDLAAYLDLLREQGIGHIESRFQRAKGDPLIVELSSVQVGENLFVHMFDDVTEQRRMMEDLRAATEAAEAANRAKSAFLANISHEIRTPMNGIIGLSRLALMAHPAPDQRELLEKISQSGRTLLQVINGLLDFAKLEAGMTQFEQIPFGLDELLDELATVAANAPANPGVELVFHPDPGLPHTLVGDRLRLGQILTNLLANALKFTQAGRVILRISQDDERHGKCWLRFDVADTGIGIPSEAMPRLFEPFSQAEAATTRRFGGTGLGLAIARELAHGMGGELSVESEPAVGSTFSLRLPFNCPGAGSPAPQPTGRRFLLDIARPATRAAVENMLVDDGLAPATDAGDADLVVCDLRDDATASALQTAARPMLVFPDGEHGASVKVACPLTPGSLRRALRSFGMTGGMADEAEAFEVPDDFAGAHLLAAEDNPVNRIVLQGLLDKAGIRSSFAEEGRQVLDIMKSAAPIPDLILMDVRMPGMDGLEATRTLRNQGFKLPIIGVSAGASDQEQQACLNAGMNDFLPKPIDADELWGCLTRWLPPRRPAAGERPVLAVEERFLNDRQALSRARKAFAEAHADDAARLADALNGDDRDSAAYIAHSLKGAAATIGEDEVAELAQQLEERLCDTATPTGQCLALVESLQTALAPHR